MIVGTFNTTALLCGLVLLVAALALFLFGRLKPELRRDSDNIYAFIGVICALITLGSISGVSILISFQLLLMIGMLIALMWENVSTRQPRDPGLRRGAFDSFRKRVSTERDRGRRSSSFYEEDRPVSTVYRYEAEIDTYDRPDDPRRQPRRIRGSEPREGYEEELDAPARRAPQGYPSQDSSRRSRPSQDVVDRPRERGRASLDEWDDRQPRSRSSQPPRREVPPVTPSRSADDWGDEPVRDRGAREGGAREVNSRDVNPRDVNPRDVNPRDLGVRNPDDLSPPPRRRPRNDVPPVNPVVDEDLGDRPRRRRSSADRPQGDRPPMERSPIDRSPMDRTGQPPLGSPLRPEPKPNTPTSSPRSGDEGYVEFKPLTPPPEDEFDNSSNFDD